MGLIKAMVNAANSVIADQWKEFIYCDALSSDVLVQKGHKRTSGGNKGSDNIITNGSGIAVADGQCMMIVDNGRIVEVCAEPGEYTYDTSSEPSVFTGDLGEAVEITFRKIGERFALGGDTGHDQRVYYFNTKELIDNKFGTPNPIPFRVVDARINLDTEVDLRCSGVYSYRISDPLLFYTNVCGNVAESYTREDIDTQLKTEFVTALAPALGKIAAQGVRPSDLTAHYDSITSAMKEELTQKWADTRGLSLVSIALNPITLSQEDSERIKAAQTATVYTDPAMAAANIAQAQAEAMKDAANNDAGAVTGFMGMGMAQATGGNVASLYEQAAQQNAQSAGVAAGPAAEVAGDVAAGAGVGAAMSAAPATDASAAPTAQAAQAAADWTCPACGTVSNGNFCPECGAAKPTNVVKPCSKCGFTPADPNNLPKFCPQYGARYGE